jgi:hypothetical protein
MPDIATELWGVQHLASLTGLKLENVSDAKSAFGAIEVGLDVVFDLGSRRHGAQHTTYHSDEGQAPGKRGSLARASEEVTARATQKPFGMWANPDYRSPLKHRINEKIALAAKYDTRELVAESWLVVSANLNRWGAAGSTMIIADALCAEDLTLFSHSELTASRFDRAFLVLHMDGIVYGWNRIDGWKSVADGDAIERAAQRNKMNKLIFDTIPRHHREHEY